MCVLLFLAGVVPLCSAVRRLRCSCCHRQPMSPSGPLPRVAIHVGHALANQATLLLSTDCGAREGRGRSAWLHSPLGGFLLSSQQRSRSSQRWGCGGAPCSAHGGTTSAATAGSLASSTCPLAATGGFFLFLFFGYR